MIPKIYVKLLKTHEDAKIPEFKHMGDAGADVTTIESHTLKPFEVYKFDTGLKMELPRGYECQVRPRSGLSTKGITIPNSPGTIDSGYRGPVLIALLNASDKEFQINKGDRIAQFVIKETLNVKFTEVTELTDTERGEGGFGSTGLRD